MSQSNSQKLIEDDAKILALGIIHACDLFAERVLGNHDWPGTDESGEPLTFRCYTRTQEIGHVYQDISDMLKKRIFGE